MCIDFNYYANDFKGSLMDEEVFNGLALKACDMIDMLTGNKIKVKGFELFTAFQQEQIKRACAAQIEYLYENGGSEFIADAGNVASVRIGNFEMGSKNRTQGDDATGGSLISPMVDGYLTLTGLLYSGVGICW